jgi:hypothetical protein
MMKKAILLGLMLILCVSFISAYTVNQPLDIQIKLQYDNGVTLTDITSSACIISIYFHGNNSLLVRDQSMIAGSYHSYSFTPVSTGDYTVNVKCDYNNESAIYVEDIVIEPPSSSVSSGGQKLILNTQISPESTSYVVNLQGQTILQFPIQYFANGKMTNSNEQEFRIVKEDKILDKGMMKITGTGNYLFDFDFKDYLTGDYKIFLYFDGRSQIVDLKVISISEDLNFITGWVIDSKGDVSPVRAITGILFLILIIIAVVVFLQSLRQRQRK